VHDTVRDLTMAPTAARSTSSSLPTNPMDHIVPHNGLPVDEALVLRTQVESLYQQAAASEQEFCIDLEGEAPDGRLVYEWMGYSRKDSATRSLSKLIEGVDFLLHTSVEQTTGRGGHNREAVLFSRDGFKRWGMAAGTDRGRQIQDYFLECERRLQLGMSQPTTLNSTLGAILQRQQELAERQMAAHQDLTGIVIDGLNQVHTKVDLGFSDVSRRFEETDERVRRLGDQLARRKAPPAKSLRLYEQLVKNHYRGCCPNCRIDKGKLQVDHWYDRSKNGLKEMWMICKECNDSLGVAGSPTRVHAERRFYQFQENLEDMITGYQIPLDLGGPDDLGAASA
jgi:5-methylcytosine-specific restriction endonuclease McrA/phage anti-repressor protein